MNSYITEKQEEFECSDYWPGKSIKIFILKTEINGYISSKSPIL